MSEGVPILYYSMFDWLSDLCSHGVPMVSTLLGMAGNSFRPSLELPALQYIANVEKDSPADQGGLQAGDFLIEVRLMLDALLYIRIQISYQVCIDVKNTLCNNSMSWRHPNNKVKKFRACKLQSSLTQCPPNARVWLVMLFGVV